MAPFQLARADAGTGLQAVEEEVCAEVGDDGVEAVAGGDVGCVEVFGAEDRQVACPGAQFEDGLGGDGERWGAKRRTEEIAEL